MPATLALTYFRQQIAVNRKPDGSEVSEADLAVDTALKLDLANKRPDYGWLSEESDDDGERLEASPRVDGRSDRRHQRLPAPCAGMDGVCGAGRGRRSR